MFKLTPLFLLLFSASSSANEYWETVLRQTEEARLRAQQIQQPIEAPKSSNFGLRFHPVLNVDRLHRGVDFAAEEGTPFNAAGSGVVLYAEERGELGLTIAIQHANGYITRYGHASQTLVIEGDIVDKHTPIGLVGSTGTATAPHVHFELIINGEHVDPSEITTLYDPNTELATLDERIDSLLSPQQLATLQSKSAPGQTSVSMDDKRPDDLSSTAGPEITSPSDVVESTASTQLSLPPTPTFEVHSPASEETLLVSSEPQMIPESIPPSEVQNETLAMHTESPTDHTENLELPSEPSNTDISEPEAVAQTSNPIIATESHTQEQALSTPDNAQPTADLPKTTWGLAEYLVKNTEYSIFQALSALVVENPKSFRDGNVHFRYADKPLRLPSLELIASQSHEEARARYYEALKPLSDQRSAQTD